MCTREGGKKAPYKTKWVIILSEINNLKLFFLLIFYHLTFLSRCWRAEFHLPGRRSGSGPPGSSSGGRHLQRQLDVCSASAARNRHMTNFRCFFLFFFTWEAEEEPWERWEPVLLQPLLSVLRWGRWQKVLHVKEKRSPWNENSSTASTVSTIWPKRNERAALTLWHCAALRYLHQSSRPGAHPAGLENSFYTTHTCEEETKRVKKKKTKRFLWLVEGVVALPAEKGFLPTKKCAVAHS